MASSSRKRPRPEVTSEDNRAECPFSIRVVDPKEKEQKKKKRRRTDAEEEEAAPRMSLQMSPFAPSGKFKTYETMDIYYQVDPAKRWTDMTRYNSFVLNGVKYFSEGFIYVANDSSIERQKAATTKEQQGQPRKKSDDDWVARILEIRASDEHHVYARVYWMYWPDELPPGTHDGKRVVSSRQSYHGVNELIASNHMDIINVVSVTAPALVNQWYEENDEEIQNALYWRQAFDVRTYELSSVEMLCKCSLPGNPDKTLIGCTTEPCKTWLHEECIKHNALLETFKRLGTDKPHRSDPAKADKAGAEGKRPLSPTTETGAAVSAQQSIDVKQATDAVHVGNNGNVEVKGPEDEDASAAPEDKTPETGTKSAVSAATKEKAGSETPSKGTPSKAAGSAKKLAKSRKRQGEGFGEGAKPYMGLFEVTLRMDTSPPILEFSDLREGIVGGDKTWTEPIKCLLCGSQIN